MSQVLINPDDLDLGEMEEVERLAEMPISEVLEGTHARGMTALVCVWMQRTVPEFSMADARKLKPADIKTGPVRPTKGGKAAS